jgi:hypothetical protein
MRSVISVVACAGLLSACGPNIRAVPPDWPAGEPMDALLIVENTHLVLPPVIRKADPYAEMVEQFLAALKFCGISPQDEEAFLDANPDIGDEMVWVPVHNYNKYPNETFSFRCPDIKRVVR